MGFTELVEPLDHNRQDELFEDSLKGGAAKESFRSFEIAGLSSKDGSYFTGMREEIVLLAWVIVLLRTREGVLPLYDWAYKGEEGNSQHNRLPTEDIIPNLQVTIGEALASTLKYVREAAGERKCEYEVSSLLISSNRLSGFSDQVNDEKTQHFELRLNAGYLEIRPIWWSENTLQHALAHMVESFVDTVRTCISNPEATIEQAMQACEADFNEIWRINHELPPTYNFCMNEMISDRAQELNDKIGICSWDGDLTYWQIDHWSSHFAWMLKDAGVQPHDIVPLCFEKSRWTIIAVLGAMKVGATFALMDPTLPLARLQNMAEQVGAKSMVSSRKQLEFASSIMPRDRILVVEPETFEDIPQTKQVDRLPKVDPHTLMYIIFTSGSTGTPKGVQISHQTYTSSAIPRAKAVGYTEQSRVLDFASYAFDVSIDSMLLTLGNGGCLCIPSDEDRLNDINQVIRSMGINYAGLTPSVGRILDQDVIRSLTGGLGLGGEAVSASDATIWGKDARIIIGYGPCECTIGCTVNSSAATGRDYISIGPGNGAVMWIVDPNDHNVLMPFGAVGELLVEGPIVGQGYLNDPEKTASAFINDPLWLTSGYKNFHGRSGRLYKTGDLGKYDPDGSGGIVFAGRKDTQVKLRGQRVELGEIESQLRTLLPSDANVIAEVIVPQGAGGQPTLVAFVTAAGQSKESVGISGVKPTEEFTEILSTISEKLAKVVPRYMVPTAYIPVNQIPVLISGKTDRKQLRAFGTTVDLRRLDQDSKSPASRDMTDLEKRLRQAWSEVLKLDESGIRLSDNFFALGGDSLAAMKLVSVCRSQGLDISVMNMFGSPYLAAMASVTQLCDSTAQSSIVPFSLISQKAEDAIREASDTYKIPEDSIEDIYPCTPTQESLFTFSLKSEKPYVAQRVAKIPADIDTDAWKFAWERVVAAIPILRSRLAQLQEPGLQQVVLKTAVSWNHSSDLDQYLQTDKTIKMNLGDELARYTIVQNSDDGTRYMVWTIHHVVYDGWSEPVILHHVKNALKDQPLDITAQMKDFVKYVKDTDELSMQDFWRRELKNAVGPQFPRLPSRDFLPIPDGMVEHDITVNPSAGFPFTMATLIRGAWSLVASRYSGNEDVVFGETLTGRDISLPGVEGIIGPLIATVPVRISAQRSLTIETFLQSIQQGVLARTPYQHMGMQNIRKVSHDAQHACEAPTGLVIQPEPDFGGSELGFAVGDVVREALHFNPYPLMVGCGIRKGGFRVCANFDSRLIQVSQMQRVLAQLQEACNQLTQDLSRSLCDTSIVPATELDEIWRLNKVPPLRFNKESSTLRSSASTKLESDYPRAINSWVCDPKNTSLLCPIGCLGELWLEGDCLPGNVVESSKWLEAGSSTYAGRNGKLQATGDIVRQHEDGSLLFIGRKEAIFAQGHAVNIAELEVHLSRYFPPTVRVGIGKLETPETAEGKQETEGFIVLLQPDVVKEKEIQLISEPYEVIFNDQNINVPLAVPTSLCIALKKFNKFIHDSLPSYMTPSGYVVVENLFSENGEELSYAELSKFASAIPQAVLSDLQDGFERAWENTSAQANLTAKEQILRAAWAKVLKMKEEKIDVDDNFFRLGGDSVLAMKLVSSLRVQGHNLSVASVFQHMRLGDAAQVLKLDESYHHTVDSYQPFGMVKELGIDSFVPQMIQPKLADQSWQVQDVFPTTDSQVMDIKATIQVPKTSYQYTVLFFEESIAQQKLLSACKELIRAHQILRTVFVEHQSKFYQVVLQDLEIAIEKFSGEANLEERVKEICEADIKNDFKLGSPFFRIVLVEGMAGRKCLILGLSHAQYDGVSLPKLLQDLEALYVGKTLQSIRPFSEYIAWTSIDQVKKPAVEYWRSLLKDSSLSSLSALQGPAMQPTDKGLFQTRAVGIPQQSSYITTANLLTAAWALVLARRLQKIDITFGGVTSGRTIEMPNVEDVVGPCYQLTPIRVIFESHWTASELLEFVQKQSAESSTYDYLGFEKISKNCTSWSSGQFFDSLVHHQDWDDFDSMPFADGHCKVDIINPHGDAPYPLKVVSYTKESQMYVGVVGRENDEFFINSVLDELASTVRELIESRTGPLLDLKLF